ncbi:MAG: hypothetical protein M1833_003184 [Piccolia ochrophora]|nr:MAG: hypothetical protein M1833_003184 [Piccolia ochrophora]
MASAVRPPTATRPQIDASVTIDILQATLWQLYISNLLLFLMALCISVAVYRDYHAFLRLGPGGTPSTFPGYLRICFLRLFAHRNPYDPSSVPLILRPERGHLYAKRANIPRRSGHRPEVTGIAPHRQITQKGQPSDFAALAAAIHSIADARPLSLTLGTSCFEKHGTGLFSLHPQHPTCKGEVCHAHPSDGSLHLTLHPDDVRLVLERGWGERHPLAKGGWLTRFVPPGFVMIYAPRDADELSVVVEIINAAVWWVQDRAISGPYSMSEKGIEDVSNDCSGPYHM